MKKKKPRFFCDGCGEEVSASAERCPRCGKFFAAIRCPSCGFSGDVETFRGGCPACGYSNPVSKRSKSLPTPRRAGIPQLFYLIGIAIFTVLLAILLMYITR
ncbi:MAG: hypothetical protein LBB22_03280 [Treponema sp.]|nr:hypothetical protein [Treponema sp.]